MYSVVLFCTLFDFCLCVFAGSKEETFFDSQAWLDSDCDDFYSVNGGRTTITLVVRSTEVNLFLFRSSMFSNLFTSLQNLLPRPPVEVLVVVLLYT